MGVCASSDLSAEQLKAQQEAIEVSKRLEQKLNQMSQEEQEVYKLLLLGTGDSGKSTLFKQMTDIYGPGFTERQLTDARHIVYGNAVVSMKQLCKQSEKYEEAVVQNKDAMDKLLNTIPEDGERLTEDIAQLLSTLWKDPGIQATWAHRFDFDLPCNCADYFYNKIEELMAPDWLPSVEDLLRTRVRTTGIVQTEFAIEGNQFKMVDVGGQRNERKKWIHSFEEVTALLFVVAISEYDQVLYEDQSTNRMVEALNLFEETCNSKWFSNTSIILFLNKSDLFREKIKKVPLRKYFPHFKGQDESYDDGVKFITEEFSAQDKRTNSQPDSSEDSFLLYSHVTCATDKGQVRFVFNCVKDIIISRSLVQAGLV
mmetsp:Transcript_25712/g.50663  ORF Transcript_25712/g.50663 Transcript_25712/m.50663 type:complete len:370 (+) Transcript_25712:36-1145(+)